MNARVDVLSHVSNQPFSRYSLILIRLVAVCSGDS